MLGPRSEHGGINGFRGEGAGGVVTCNTATIWGLGWFGFKFFEPNHKLEIGAKNSPIL